MSLTLYRKNTHAALSRLNLSGKVLDLGGSSTSTYLQHIQGDFTVSVVNTDEKVIPDFIWDLENTPYPFESSTYETVLAINVLEHIWSWRGLLSEALRILKPKGTIIVAVPFLHAVHPSPQDFFRFTKEALIRALSEAGFEDVVVEELGQGVFVSAFSFFQRFFPGSLVSVLSGTVIFADKCLTYTMNKMHRKYSPVDYPLGYIALGYKRPNREEIL